MTPTRKQIQDAIERLKPLINDARISARESTAIVNVICALRAYEARSDEPVAWISVDDRLPRRNVNVLAWHKTAYGGYPAIVDEWRSEYVEQHSITHWLTVAAPSHVAQTKGDPGDIKRGNAEMHRPDLKVTYAIAGKEET